jgi:hypothetical protein
MGAFCVVSNILGYQIGWCCFVAMGRSFCAMVLFGGTELVEFVCSVHFHNLKSFARRNRERFKFFGFHTILHFSTETGGIV